jgi:AraC family transcriptional regulator
LPLAELARAVQVHPVHLSRTFRRRFHRTVADYVRSLRLDWSARQLATGEEPLCAIALRAGFADQSHFGRVFKQHTGMTPARYRRSLRGEKGGGGPPGGEGPPPERD